ncbi:MAG: tetratricopeptide repeat protein [Candidatus Hermodarchaeota archaeon]
MPNLIEKKLGYMNQLFVEGLYSNVLDSIEEFEQIEDLTTEDRISCCHLKSNLYFEICKYTDAFKFAEQACNMSRELGNKSLILDSYISKARASLMLRDYDLVSQLISNGEEMLRELTLKPQSEIAKREALLNFIKSQIYFSKNGDIEKSLEYGELGLKISEEHENKVEMALALQLNARSYLMIGNLDRALDYLKRCLSIQRTYRKRDDWWTLNNLGVLNGMRGELDLALDYIKQSLALAEELGNKKIIGQCLNNASLIYRQKGELDRALEALERNLMIWEELGDKMNRMGGLDSLFIVSLDANSLEKAQDYLLGMQEINEQVQDHTCEVACRVNKALMLKMSPDSHDQEKAKEILQQIVNDDIINWEFTERGLLHLCDIFLNELQRDDNEEVLDEINILINKLLDFAKFQNSYRLLAETNLLQGKLALIQMNLGDSRKLFTKAERIADEHGLHLLARTISTEHDNLLEELEKWETLRKVKAPVSERLKHAEIDKTLNHMMGKQMMEPPDLVEEDPILLLIMDESGNPYFNHTFIKDWDFSDLFSSFISAFNTFSSEIFSKTIDRIKIGENIIFLQPVEQFLTCYVSKGQSYPAMKKLTKFSDSIKTKSEIWEKLKKAAETCQVLKEENLPILGSVVDEIFTH